MYSNGLLVVVATIIYGQKWRDAEVRRNFGVLGLSFPMFRRILPPIAENPCECKIPAEYTCPETFRYPTPTPNPRGKPYPIRKSRQAGTVNCQFEQTRSGNCVPCGGKIES